MDVCLEDRADHVRLTVSGAFDAPLARRMLVAAAVHSAEIGVGRVLVDARGITGKVSIADRYLLAMHLAARANVAFRMAVVAVERSSKVLEDTATERKVALRTTSTLQEAAEYLGIDLDEAG